MAQRVRLGPEIDTPLPLIQDLPHRRELHRERRLIDLTGRH